MLEQERVLLLLYKGIFKTEFKKEDADIIQ